MDGNVGAMRWTTAVENGTALVTLSGEIDMSAMATLSRVLIAAVREHNELVLDMADVRYVDSSGLQLLLRVESEAREVGHRLQLLSPSRQVVRVIEIAGLAEVFGLDRKTEER